MKKKILSFMAVILLLGSVCMNAFAEGDINREPVQREGGTAAALKSYGKIVYQKGTDTIKIDSDDLYMLADQIDQVKLDVTDQLEAMNTYFTAGEGEILLTTSEDINVVHAKPYEQDFVDPLDVNFDTLLEGIAVSQSVSSDVTAYGYPAGTELYKNAEGLLTTDGSGKGSEQISVTAATADDLSAGTAAWVDGKLILGTGEDNKSYLDYGYNKGLEEGTPGNIADRITIPFSYVSGNNVGTYSVPKEVSGSLLWIETRRESPSISFSSPDGSNVPFTSVFTRVCYEDDGTYHRRGFLYYIPKMKANTRITISVPGGISNIYLILMD